MKNKIILLILNLLISDLAFSMDDQGNDLFGNFSAEINLDDYTQNQQDFLARELIEAFNSNNIERVKQLIDIGARFNTNVDSVSSALIESQKKGNKEIKDDNDNEYNSPIFIDFANEDTIEQPKDGKKLGEELIQAAWDNQIEKVKESIKSGADIDAKDEQCSTPLIIASTFGHREIVELLIKFGADVNVKNIFGKTALICASRSGWKEIVELLIKARPLIDEVDNEGNTSLVIASLFGHKEIVELLIKAGADVNAKDGYGNTILIWASKNGYNEIVKLSIQSGADVNVQDRSSQNNDPISCGGNTALIWAAINGYKEIAESLIKAGADLKIKNQSNYTALIAAAHFEKNDVVGTLNNHLLGLSLIKPVNSGSSNSESSSRPAKKVCTIQNKANDNFKCPIEGCHSVFQSESTMKSHKIRSHGADKNKFKCQNGSCNFACGERSVLTNHIIHAHVRNSNANNNN